MGADPARTVLRAPRLCYCPVPKGSREARLTLVFIDKEVPALATLRCSLASSSELTGPAVKGVRGCRPLAAVPGVFWVQGAFPSSTLLGDLQAACRVTWRLFFSTPTFPKQLPRLRPQGPRGRLTPRPPPALHPFPGHCLMAVPSRWHLTSCPCCRPKSPPLPMSSSCLLWDVPLLSWNPHQGLVQPPPPRGHPPTLNSTGARLCFAKMQIGPCTPVLDALAGPHSGVTPKLPPGPPAPRPAEPLPPLLGDPAGLFQRPPSGPPTFLS